MSLWSYFNGQQLCDERQEDVVLAVPNLLAAHFHAAPHAPALPAVAHQDLTHRAPTNQHLTSKIDMTDIHDQLFPVCVCVYSVSSNLVLVPGTQPRKTGET